MKRAVYFLAIGALLLLAMWPDSARRAAAQVRVTPPPFVDTATPTSTPDPDASPTPTAAGTFTPTSTITSTLTQTPTPTMTGTAVATPTITPSPSPSPTPHGARFYLPVTYFQRPPSPPGCMPLPHIPPTSLSKEADLVRYLNGDRVANGVATLIWANGPTQASRRHADDMALNGVEGFVGSDGSNPGERLREACYEWVAIGQIIGWGYPTAEEMAAFWINSPAHSALILDPSYDDIGPGYAFNPDSTWRHYWSVVFARRAGPREELEAATAVFTCTWETGSARSGARLTWAQAEPCPR